MTDTLPFTVFVVKGPILIGERPALKITGKVKWDKPFLKHVTDDGIGVDDDIFGSQLIFLFYVVNLLRCFWVSRFPSFSSCFAVIFPISWNYDSCSYTSYWLIPAPCRHFKTWQAIISETFLSAHATFICVPSKIWMKKVAYFCKILGTIHKLHLQRGGQGVSKK